MIYNVMITSVDNPECKNLHNNKSFTITKDFVL